MAQITAAQVNELRNKTGLGMMECKKLLTEAEGNVDKAIDIARKKGVKTSITERQAGEGRIAVGTSSDNKHSFAVEVNCNTDFTAKSDVVTNIMKAGIEKFRSNPKADLKNDPQMQQMLTAASQQTGENVQLGQAVSMAPPTGPAGAYP